MEQQMHLEMHNFGATTALHLQSSNSKLKSQINGRSMGSIKATVFPEIAEPLFDITGAEVLENASEGCLSTPILQLSTPRKCAMILKAYMYDYGGISQCKSNIQAFFNLEMAGDLTTYKPLSPTRSKYSQQKKQNRRLQD